MAVYYAGFIPTGDVYAVLFPDLPGCMVQWKVRLLWPLKP